MIVFGESKTVHSDLSTGYVALGQLLDQLKESAFTGYVLLHFWEYEGYVLLENGSTVAVFEREGQNERSGPKALDTILERSSAKGGFITVEEVSSDALYASQALHHTDKVYEGLHNDFTNLDALKEKLAGENHSGYIEIVNPASPSVAYIAFLEGAPFETLYLEDRAAHKGRTVGSQAQAQATELATQSGTIFNVYAAKEVSDDQSYEVSPEAPVQGSHAVSTNGSGKVEDFPAAVARSQELMRRGEAQLEPVLGASGFHEALLRARNALADTYDFLDPFASEWDYAGGEVLVVEGLEEHVDYSTYLEGVTALLKNMGYEPTA